MRLENLFLDQLIIHLLIFFVIIMTILLALYRCCKEKFCVGYLGELKG